MDGGLREAGLQQRRQVLGTLEAVADGAVPVAEGWRSGVRGGAWGWRAPIAAASRVFESRAPYELAYWTKLGLV